MHSCPDRVPPFTESDRGRYFGQRSRFCDRNKVSSILSRHQPCLMPAQVENRPIAKPRLKRRCIEGQRPGDMPVQGKRGTSAALGLCSKKDKALGARQRIAMVPPLQGFACLLSVTQGVAGLAWGRAFGPRYSAPLVLQRRFRDPPVFNCVWCDSGLAGSDPSPDSDTNRLRGRATTIRNTR